MLEIIIVHMNCKNHKKINQRVIPTVQVVILLAGILSMTVASFISTAHATDQAIFKTADMAVDALANALAQDDTEALLNIFGKEYEYELTDDDKISRERAAQAIKQENELRDEGADKKVLYMGSETWPLPFPLVKTEAGWHFDTEAGIEELVNRRIGRNELNAIEICQLYIDAQVEYANTDRDGDEVREYAQRIASTPGKKDGLFWKEVEGEKLSPFGPLVADARGYLVDREPGDPFKGYYYKVITRQGSDAIGGRYDYIINGNMIAGFALIAFPAEHGNTGIMTFTCSHQGKVYQKDFGEDSNLIAAGVDEYNPDSSWVEVKIQ